jgi:hypothetical protein
MGWHATEAVDRAVDLYFRWGDRHGLTLMQPNRNDSEQVGDKVIPRDANGDLARYRIMDDGSMRRIWPRSIN